MRVLPDTSIWVDYLRHDCHGSARGLDGLLQRKEAVVCGPVVAEVLTGAGFQLREELWELLGSLPWADVGAPEWRSVGDVSAALRARGERVALTDVEIAVAAGAAGASLDAGF